MPSLVAVPVVVATVVDPVMAGVASVAVIVWVTPAVVDVVNTTVAWPDAFVVLVEPAKLPPFVEPHVTVRPLCATGLFDASISCAVIVEVPPAATLLGTALTWYAAAAPADST